MARKISAKRAVALVDRVEALPDVAEGWSDPWHTKRLDDAQVKDTISDTVDTVRKAIGRDRLTDGSNTPVAEAICDFAYDGDASGIPGVYGAIRDNVSRDGLSDFDEAMRDRSIDVAGGTPTVLWYGRPADDISYLTLKSVREALMLADDMAREGAGDARMAAGTMSTITDQLVEIDDAYLAHFGARSLEDATDGELAALSHGGYSHEPESRDAYAKACQDDPAGLAREIDRIAADVLPLDKLARYDYGVVQDDAASGITQDSHLSDLFSEAVSRAQATIDGADAMAKSGLSLDYASGYGIVCAYDDDPENMIDATLSERDRALAYIEAVSQDANQPDTDRMLAAMSAFGLDGLRRPEPRQPRRLADFDDEGFTEEPEEDFDWHDDDDDEQYGG